MAPHSSTLAWKIPWMEEPGGLQSMGRSESDTTDRLHFHVSLSCIGEGNGNPLQCSCLENPRDGGAWWAAVYGVAQSRTRLKRLSSSSSSSICVSNHHIVQLKLIQCFVSIASQNTKMPSSQLEINKRGLIKKFVIWWWFSCWVMSDSRYSMDSSQPGSSVHGILQARVLEWIAVPFSRGSSQPRNRNWVSCIAGRFFTNWGTGEARNTHGSMIKNLSQDCCSVISLIRLICFCLS